MNKKELFVQNALNSEADLPFSFIYRGYKSDTFIKAWTQNIERKILDNQRTLHCLTCRDPKTSLEIRLEAIEYMDFPAIEWVLHFHNRGNIDSPILEHILPLDIKLQPQANSPPVTLRHLRGSSANREDFSPVEMPLIMASSKKIGCFGGRSSDRGDCSPHNEGSMPFFNLEFDGGGIIFAIGWSGTWVADFVRDAKNVLSVQAGMEHTHLKLHTDEQIRTPSILMFFWEGGWMAAQNHFRKFILTHCTPRKDDKPVELPLAACSWSLHNCGSEVSEQNQIELIQKYIAKDIGLECYWLDAGWYEGVNGIERWGECVGNWFPKKRTFPNGLKPVATEAAKNNLGFVLWFEPERVKPGTHLYQKHPDWLLMPDEEIIKERSEMFTYGQPWTNKVEALLDLGNPQARRWLIDHYSSIIEECGVTIYRQDFNIQPAKYWRAADASDRQGITEIRFIEGLYDFWDELLRRHPGLVIDNCASGGRRIDLEIIKRSIVLHRTDGTGDPDAAQSHSMGLNLFYPCSGAATSATDSYIFRSCLAAGMSIGWNVYDDAFDADTARRCAKEFKILRPLFYGDFWPLTRHNAEQNSDVWCVYQLHREDLGRGAVVAFRRKNSPYSIAKFTLNGLKKERKYEFVDIDTDAKSLFTGNDLLHEGIEITLPNSPQAKIMLYSFLD